MPTHVEGDVALQRAHELRPLGARADEAHISSENVDQLRQFVNFCLPQQPPDASDPRIFSDRYQPAFVVEVLSHRTELINKKWTETSSHAFLFKENGARRIEFDKYSGQK
jgi:hypothetical protein